MSFFFSSDSITLKKFGALPIILLPIIKVIDTCILPGIWGTRGTNSIADLIIEKKTKASLCPSLLMPSQIVFQLKDAFFKASSNPF